jgi:hypothetical protein
MCAILLIASLFKMLYHPLRWLALGAAVAGLPPILMRSVAAIQRLTLDINSLLVIAGTGTFFFLFKIYRVGMQISKIRSSTFMQSFFFFLKVIGWACKFPKSEALPSCKALFFLKKKST